MKILIMVLYLFFAMGGIIFMKLGGDSLFLSFKNGFEFKIGFLTFVGFVLYVFSFFLWQRIIVMSDISYIVPLLTGIAQVVILIAGYYIFKESVNIYGVLGVLLIMGGIALMTFGRG
jgi:small multidrug resistance pump